MRPALPLFSLAFVRSSSQLVQSTRGFLLPLLTARPTNVIGCEIEEKRRNFI
jgi:hypothetical protein